MNLAKHFAFYSRLWENNTEFQPEDFHGTINLTLRYHKEQLERVKTAVQATTHEVETQRKDIENLIKDSGEE